MLTPPTDLDPKAVRQTIIDHWGVDGIELTWLPVGFGSQHWSATQPDGRRWFVIVDDHRGGRMGHAEPDSVDGLDRAFRVAAWLQDACGLSFVVGAVMSQAGRAVRRIGDTPWSVALFRHLDAKPLGVGGDSPRADRTAVLRLLAQLHSVPVSQVSGLARVDDLAIGRRAVLDAALADLETPWVTGPFAESTRQLLSTHSSDLRPALAAHDVRADALRRERASWVVTHGEPHSANILRDATGDLFLIDWDTVAIGPRERDLWMLDVPPGSGDWSSYLAESRTESVSTEAIRTYRTWWDLTEISEFVAGFRRPHDDSEDMRASWGYLQDYLPLKRD